MSYRESASNEHRLNDRQIEWIERISSVAAVRAFLKGEDPGREDAADAVVFAYGAATVAANVIGSGMILASDFEVTLVSAGFLGLSLLAGFLGLRRYRDRTRRFRDRRFDIVTLVPKFERRIVGTSPDDRAVTFFDVGPQQRVWPERLESLRASLGQDEQIRVCIVHTSDRSYVEWAFPL